MKSERKRLTFSKALVEFGYIMEEWMTINEVAKYLRVSKDWVYKAAQKGKIPTYKIGGLWRFKEKEIDEWLEANKRGGNQ